MTDWPVNYAEQASLVAEYQARIDALKKTNTTVSVVSHTPPLKSQWEAAFVQKTKLPLPIPVGARLLWLNPFSGEVRNFTIVNDLNNGADSSGEPIEAVSPNSDTGALRLLGTQNELCIPRSAVHRPNILGKNIPNPFQLQGFIPINFIKAAKEGAHSLLIFGQSLDGPFVGPGDAIGGVQVVGSDSALGYTFEGYRTRVASSSVASNVSTGTRNFISIYGSTTGGSILNSFFVQIDLVAMRLLTGNFEIQTYMQFSRSLLVSPGVEFVIDVHHAIKPMPFLAGVTLYLSGKTDTSTNGKIASSSPYTPMQVWAAVYGLYRSNRPSSEVY